nr:Ig-like domain-containing protein [Quadrisphaera sp. RL12-1S]
MAPVDDWKDLAPPSEDGQQQSDEAGEQQSTDQQADRSTQNRPPVAQDDDFGVRPGRSTVLPVLDNDVDPDGDVLTASPVDPSSPIDPPGGLGAGARVSVVRGGAALQVSVPADATGNAAVAYTADDGRGGTAQATARVQVHGWDANAAPHQDRVPVAQLEAGSSTTVDALSGWTDPDGDDVSLAGAQAPAGLDASWTPGGQLTLTAGAGQPAGPVDVAVTVTDGREPASGTLRVQVLAAGAAVPVTRPDHVSTTVDAPVQVSPLANDSQAGGRPLRLVGVDPTAGVAVTVDALGGTAVLTPSAQGTSYLTYRVSDGAHEAQGVIRLDALAAAGADRPPVAVADTAQLPPGGEVVVDVTANDEDPDGDVLAVSGAVTPAPGDAAAAGLVADVLEQHLVRVHAPQGLTGPATLRYTVTDGQQQDEGTITVVPAPAPVVQAPLARPDSAVVRAGDVVSVPVLANDESRGGGPLSLVVGDDALQPAAAGAQVFASGDRLRVRAPDAPGTYTATYTARDARGAEASAQVTLTVIAVDATGNRAPVVPPVVARAVAGATTRIVVPLDGTDPDGDSVRLVGVQTPPAHGRVSAVGDGWVDLQADPSATGTDAFTLGVVDRLGASASVSVRVALVARGADRPPAAVDDAVTVRSGRTASVPVLANDSDPDGDRLSVVPGSTTAPARVEGDQVVVPTAAGTASTTSTRYTVQDQFGATASAAVTVTASPDAPDLVPVAVDDRVDVLQLAAAGTVDVPVLDNDVDLDGPHSALVVSLPAGAAGAAGADGAKDAPEVVGTSVRVHAASAPQAITYEVRDADGGVGRAVVWVPGTAAAAPALRSGAPEIKVTAGQSVRLSLADAVVTAPGRSPRLVADAPVVAAGGTATTDGDGAVTFVATQPGPGAVTVTVADGPSGDAATRTARLSLPVTVLPGGGAPPVLAGGSLQAVAGGPTATLDLRRLATDPDTDASRLRFALAGGAPGGLRVSVEGSVLSASAPAGTPAGQVPVQVSASDGTSSATGVVVVTVTAAAGPLVQAVADAASGPPGTATSVPVLANDVGGPGASLSLVSASSEQAGFAVTTSGDRVVVTPAGTAGTATVRYRVTDAPGDTTRTVEGVLTFTIASPPGQPGAPQVVSTGADSAVLAWQAPSSSAPVTGYVVRGQGLQQQCPATTCTVTGLVAGTVYAFTVTAQSSVGAGPPSAPSSSITVGGAPTAPAAPSVTPGDQQLSAAWQAAGGPPAARYDVEVSPAGGTPAVNGTSAAVGGLTNGQAYQVRVRGVSASGAAGEWSGWSASAVPAGRPSVPSAPQVQQAGGQATVSWTAPATDNGSPVLRYEVEVTAADGSTRTVQVAAGTTVQVPTGAGGSFRVRAVSASGTSDWSGATQAPAGAAGAVAPDVPAAAATVSADGTVAVTATAAAGGTAPTRYEARVDGGRPTALDGAAGSLQGLAAGAHTVEVRACAGDACSGWSTATSVTVPAAPAKPSADRQVSLVIFNPHSDSANAYHVSITGFTPNTRYAVQCLLDGAQVGSGVLTTDASGAAADAGSSASGGVSCAGARAGGTATARVDGVSSNAVVVQPHIDTPSTPEVPKAVSLSVATANGGNGAGAAYTITVTGFAPNGTVAVDCLMGGQRVDGASLTTGADGSGTARCTAAKPQGQAAQASATADGVRSNTVMVEPFVPPAPRVAKSVDLSLMVRGAGSGNTFVVKLAGFTPGDVVNAQCILDGATIGGHAMTIKADGTASSYDAGNGQGDGGVCSTTDSGNGQVAVDGVASNTVKVAPAVKPASRAMKGDATGDGKVNQADIDTVYADWGTGAERSDFDGDGTVDVRDLSILLSNWTGPGQAPAAAPPPGATP